MYTPSACVIWLIGTPMALAFSRSIWTSCCGSFAVKLVNSPVRSLPLAAGADDLVRDACRGPAAYCGPGPAARIGIRQSCRCPEWPAVRNATTIAPGTPNSFGADARHNIAGGMAFAFALVNRFERSEDQARSSTNCRRTAKIPGPRMCRRHQDRRARSAPPASPHCVV